ncbi:ABC transporter substrate-binding protein [Marinisporobacter balticus]|uniref:NitT/TauT family transport system substrate-binding protein n=1 Tax=Marinisporobacter balticus TaxID=2018667 RepID=A0A4R2L115_9FIRM|nr:ABC transporter substrate-binding protein [Marinisporobacter balticus]TCO72695.1 NitT/TauT family transport system substrate-binding protein [Marinisporobacter balticus]
MKKGIIALMIITLLGSVMMTGCSNNQEAVSNEPSSNNESLKKMNIGYLASPEHLLYFVAKEKGFFEEQGIDAELFQFTNSAEGLNAITAGKLDVGSFGVSAPLAFIAKDVDVSIIGGQNSGACAVVSKPEKYEEMKDLKNYKGKKVATVRLSTADVIFRGALLDQGIDWKKGDVEIIEMESPAATMEAVKKESVDAGLIWTPFVAMAEDQGVKIAMHITDLLENNVCCRQHVLTSKLNEDPELWENFLVALIKAFDFYQTNQEETVDITAKYVKVDKKYLWKETYAEDATMITSPDPLKKSTIKYWNIMKETGFIDSDKNIEDYINTDIYKKALDRVLKENPDNQNYKRLLSDFNKYN